MIEPLIVLLWIAVACELYPQRWEKAAMIYLAAVPIFGFIYVFFLAFTNQLRIL